jgi:hypothetical protein
MSLRRRRGRSGISGHGAALLSCPGSQAQRWLLVTSGWRLQWAVVEEAAAAVAVASSSTGSGDWGVCVSLRLGAVRVYVGSGLASFIAVAAAAHFSLTCRSIIALA